MSAGLCLPYPPAELNPNKRLHWSKKLPYSNGYKRICWGIALEAGWKKLALKDGEKVHLWIDFYPPDRRKRDDDNIAAAFKSGRDGIAKALGVDDSKFVSHPFLADYDPEFSGVKVRFSLFGQTEKKHDQKPARIHRRLPAENWWR